MLRVILGCAASFAAGFAVATFLTRTKYEDMANEEIQAMREYVKKKTGDDIGAGSDVSKKQQVEQHKSDLERFEKERTDYATGSTKEVTIVNEQKPYRIPEEDFVVDDEDFEKVTLEYYTESELLYEGSEVVSNVEDIVGSDCLNLLHGFSDDTIYVRNEKYGIDYEVIKISGSGPER